MPPLAEMEPGRFLLILCRKVAGLPNLTLGLNLTMRAWDRISRENPRRHHDKLERPRPEKQHSVMTMTLRLPAKMTLVAGPEVPRVDHSTAKAARVFDSQTWWKFIIQETLNLEDGPKPLARCHHCPEKRLHLPRKPATTYGALRRPAVDPVDRLATMPPSRKNTPKSTPDRQRGPTRVLSAECLQTLAGIREACGEIDTTMDLPNITDARQTTIALARRAAHRDLLECSATLSESRPKTASRLSNHTVLPPALLLRGVVAAVLPHVVRADQASLAPSLAARTIKKPQRSPAITRTDSALTVNKARTVRRPTGTDLPMTRSPCTGLAAALAQLLTSTQLITTMVNSRVASPEVAATLTTRRGHDTLRTVSRRYTLISMRI